MHSHIRQPKQHASQDQEQTNTDIIKTLRRKSAGKKRLITKRFNGFDYKKRESNKDKVPSRNSSSN